MNFRITQNINSTIPLNETPGIHKCNALQMDWQALPSKGETFSYILGNPTFIGSKMMDARQRKKVMTRIQKSQRFYKSLSSLHEKQETPAELLAAHQRLDLAVDAWYGIKKGFQREEGRVGWLFGRWETLIHKNNRNGERN